MRKHRQIIGNPILLVARWIALDIAYPYPRESVICIYSVNYLMRVCVQSS